MNIFKIVEGLHGECLASAILKYALIQSSMLRTSFANWLATNTPRGLLPEFDCGLICNTESDFSLDGRVDITIETSSHVIFIENKLSAAFGDHQLQRYSNALRKHAEKTSRKGILIVLYPKLRSKEVQDHIAHDGLCDVKLLTWEMLSGWIEDASSVENTETAVVFKLLVEFIRCQIVDYDAPIRAEELVGPHVACPNSMHWKFLKRIEDFFEHPTKRFRRADKHDGFGFLFSDGDKDKSGWIGFEIDEKLQSTILTMRVPSDIAAIIDSQEIPGDFFRKHREWKDQRYYSLDLQEFENMADLRRAVEPVLNVINTGIDAESSPSVATMQS